MGYSCTANADYTLRAIDKLLPGPSSNSLPGGGFYEIGRQRNDGAITGTVWKPSPRNPELVVRHGSFRIELDGRVSRFPGLPSALLRQAENMARAEYAAYYGSWRERGAAFLARLEAGEMDGAANWEWFESIAREWQREARIVFAVMPAANSVAMVRALRSMLGK